MGLVGLTEFDNVPPVNYFIFYCSINQRRRTKQPAFTGGINFVRYRVRFQSRRSVNLFLNFVDNILSD
jgi:hypothetical protein